MPAKKVGTPLSECRACREPIRFVALDTGKAMPVNPLPNPAGNVAASRAGHRLTGFVISKDRQPARGVDRFMPHYATCEVVKRKTSTSSAPVEQEEPLW